MADDSVAIQPAGRAKIASRGTDRAEPRVTRFVATHYVRDGRILPRKPIEITPRTTTIEADGKDCLVLSDLPQPCTVTIQGAIRAGPITVEDGSLEISCDQPGLFRVVITADPEWVAWEGVFHAA
jgi:hypothetical protein